MAGKHAREDSQSGDWVVGSVEEFKPIYDRYIRPHIELDDLVAGDDEHEDQDGADQEDGAAAAGDEAPPAFDPRTPTAEQFWNEAAARASGTRAARSGGGGARGKGGEGGGGGREKALGAEEMLKHLVEGSAIPLARLCKTLDGTLEEVSAWIGDRRNRAHVGNLVHLLDAQTQLLMSQHRLAAVARLSQLLRDERASPETARRACSDLLKIQLVEPAEAGDASDVERDGEESPMRAAIVMPQGGISQAFREACRESTPIDEAAEGDEAESAADGFPAEESSRGARITIEGKEARRP